MKRLLLPLLLAVVTQQSTNFLSAMNTSKDPVRKNKKNYLTTPKYVAALQKTLPETKDPQEDLLTDEQRLANDIARYMEHFVVLGMNLQNPCAKDVWPSQDDYRLQEALDEIMTHGRANLFYSKFIKKMENKSEYDKYMKCIDEVFLPTYGNNVTVFNASWYNITQLPPFLQKCPSLKEMNLTGNRGITITHLPQSLVVIKLISCALTKVPEALATCDNLEEIDLRSNPNIIVPAWLASLPKLKLVNFTNCRFTEEEIKELQKLFSINSTIQVQFEEEL